MGTVEIRLSQAQFFQEALERLDASEREFLELMRAGNKDESEFLTVLRRFGLPAEPGRDVKNAKERLMRKLKAFARAKGYELDDLLAN